MFSSKIEKALIQAFEEISTDPSRAVRATKGKYLDDWIAEQKALVTATGATANLLPGAHLAAMVADLAFLLNRMSYASWGVGAIKRCKVFGMSDFKQILTIWCGENPEWDDFSAISLNFANMLEDLSDFDPDETNEHVYYNSVANLYNSGKSLGSAVRNINDYSGAKGLRKKLAKKKAIKLGSKLAAKLSVKLAKKLGAKAATGFIPGIGAIVGGGVNLWIMDGITDAACKYYRKAK